MDQNDKVFDGLRLELRRGTLVLCVLSQLKTPKYGYSLSSSLKEKGLTIEQNTLYPLLRRLEKQGLLESNWALQDSRQRRYYVLSEYGQNILRRLIKEWVEICGTVNQFIKEEVE